jgi:hypothetical protein
MALGTSSDSPSTDQLLSVLTNANLSQNNIVNRSNNSDSVDTEELFRNLRDLTQRLNLKETESMRCMRTYSYKSL